MGDHVISVIEWGDRVREALPDDLIEIAVSYGEAPDDRVFHIQVPNDRDMSALEEISS